MDREIPKSERLKTLRRRWGKVAIGVAVAVAAVVIAGMMMRTGVKRSSINTGKVDKGTLETSVAGTGNVVAAFEQIINSPISSRIVEVYCKEGDTLVEGTPLLRLDLESAENEIKRMAEERQSKVYQSQQATINSHTRLSDLEMQVKVKEMAVNRLAAEAANERRLDSIGSGTGERVQQAEFAWHTGELELDQLRKQLANERRVQEAARNMSRLELSIFDKNYNEKQQTLEDARLKSPRRATLTYINDRIGQQVSQGERVATIADLSHFKISAEIADTYADRVAIGSHVVVKSGSTELTGKVTHVTPLSKNGVINFTVMLDEDDHPRLRSGLKTEVHVLCDIHDSVLRIPTGPYFKGPGSYDLFVVEGDELHRRKVQLGDSNYEFVEVKSGLSEGETVVISDLTDQRSNSTLKLK